MLIKKTNAVYNPDLKAKLNANKDTATKKKKKNTGTEKWAELIEMARKSTRTLQYSFDEQKEQNFSFNFLSQSNGLSLYNVSL